MPAATGPVARSASTARSRPPMVPTTTVVTASSLSWCVASTTAHRRPADGARRGLGLEGLRERLRLLGGELHVSQPAGQTATPDRSDRTEQPRRFVVMAAVPARGRAD